MDAGPAAPALSLVLRQALAGSAAPVIYHGDRTLPAASLWVGARNTVRQLRDAGVPPGARLRLHAPDPLSLAVLTAATLSGGFHLELAPSSTYDPDLRPAVVLFGRRAPEGASRVTVSGLEALQVPDGLDGAGPGITAVGVHCSSAQLAHDVHIALQHLSEHDTSAGLRPLGVHTCHMPLHFPDLVDDLLLPLIAAEFLVFQDPT